MTPTESFGCNLGPRSGRSVADNPPDAREAAATHAGGRSPLRSQAQAFRAPETLGNGEERRSVPATPPDPVRPAIGSGVLTNSASSTGGPDAGRA